MIAFYSLYLIMAQNTTSVSSSNLDTTLNKYKIYISKEAEKQNKTMKEVLENPEEALFLGIENGFSLSDRQIKLLNDAGYTEGNGYFIREVDGKKIVYFNSRKASQMVLGNGDVEKGERVAQRQILNFINFARQKNREKPIDESILDEEDFKEQLWELLKSTKARE